MGKMDFETQIIYLASGDPTAIGSNSDFTLQLAQPLNLVQGKYEVLLVDASCAKPVSTPRSLFFYLDLVDGVMLGSSTYPLLFKSPPVSDPGTGNALFIVPQGTFNRWVPCQPRVYRSVRVWITDSTGASISTGFESILTIAIRRVSD
jgi:hypothetical protein